MTEPLSLEDLFHEIADRVLEEFIDIVDDARIQFTSSGAVKCLRIFLRDGSFVDVWLSFTGKYSYHWEHRHLNGFLYRHDNAPHRRWDRIETFPKHFHDGSEENVMVSYISDEPREAVREFLRFIRSKLGVRSET